MRTICGIRIISHIYVPVDRFHYNRYKAEIELYFNGDYTWYYNH